MPATVHDWAHSSTSSCRVHRLLLHGKREARRPPILSTCVISLVKKEKPYPGEDGNDSSGNNPSRNLSRFDKIASALVFPRADAGTSYEAKIQKDASKWGSVGSPFAGAYSSPADLLGLGSRHAWCIRHRIENPEFILVY